jgi:predicted amidophosphoribosyltransferase
MSLEDARLCPGCGKHRTQHPSGFCPRCRLLRLVEAQQRDPDGSDSDEKIKSEFDTKEGA